MAIFVVLSAIWGCSFLFIKVAVAELSPLMLIAGRTVIGGAVLAAILPLRGRRLPRELGMWGHLVFLAALGNVLPWTLVAWAEQSIPSGLAAVLNALVPALTLATAVLAGIEQLSARKAAGLGVAVLGSALVVSGEVGEPGRVAALAAMLVATVLYATTAVYTKRFVSGRIPSLSLAAGQVLAGAVLAVPAAFLVGPVPGSAALRWEVVASVVALGALGTGVAFLLFYLLLERVGATYTTMVTYLIPVVGLLAGWLVLGESFGWHVIAGMVVIVAGIWLAQRERVRAGAEAEQEPVAA